MVWFLGSLFSFHNFSIIDENDDVYVWPLGGGCEEKKKKKPNNNNNNIGFYFLGFERWMASIIC